MDELPALVRGLDGRVAVVSGRPVDQILHYLGADRAAPGFAVAGSLEFPPILVSSVRSWE